MSSLLAGPKKRKQANSEKFIDLENKDHEIKPGLKSESDDIEIVENESKRFKAAPSTDFAKSIVEPASSRDQLHNDYESRWLQKISHLPLSEKLRPKELRDYVGQQHILSQDNGTLFK